MKTVALSRPIWLEMSPNVKGNSTAPATPLSTVMFAKYLDCEESKNSVRAPKARLYIPPIQTPRAKIKTRLKNNAEFPMAKARSSKDANNTKQINDNPNNIFRIDFR